MRAHAVLVPSYNSAATVRETLESLLAQDLSAVDAVYLADDGSSDGTVGIARGVWQSATPLIVSAHQHNQGQWRNVNTALQKMPGHLQWVHILHSDDIARPQWLREMVQQIDRAGQRVASVCSSWDNLNADGSIETGENEPDKPVVHIDGSSESVRSTLHQGCWWHISGCAIRLAAFRDVGGFVEKYPQSSDWEWLLRCLQRGWDVDYIPQTLIGYRMHAGSVSNASFREHRDVSESFDIIKLYAASLTRREVYRLYTRKAWYLTRRIGSSLLQPNPERARKALALLVRVPAFTRAALLSRQHTK